jgi:uncharacterized protein
MRSLIFIIVLLCVAVPIWSSPEEVCFKDSCFEVELVTTPAQRSQGLMFRRKLDHNKGMLFVFEEEDIHSFWMKNMFIALDMVWINKEKQVVYISKNVQPCKSDPCPQIHPEQKAIYVLEVNAGVCERIGLRVGDALSFDAPTTS